MSCGPITKACRVFLSRNHLYPGNVSRAMMDATLRTARGPHRRLQLQGRNWRSLLEGGNAHNDAYLEYYLGSGDLLLKVKRKRFWYREHRNGLADLIIFN